jgi:hypothetical protein
MEMTSDRRDWKKKTCCADPTQWDKGTKMMMCVFDINTFQMSIDRSGEKQAVRCTTMKQAASEAGAGRLPPMLPDMEPFTFDSETPFLFSFLAKASS